MAAEPVPFSAPKLGLAVLVGVALQALLLAFGLYANLVMDRLCRSSPTCYWALNGVYLVLGVGLGLLVIPWASVRVRAAVLVLILVIGLAIGLRSVDGW